MNAILVVLSAAKREFGDPRTWNRPLVTEWVKARMKRLYAGEPEPMPQHQNVVPFAPMVPDDERDAIQLEATEDGWR